MTGKYTPFEHYLRDLPASEREATLSFEQIERILDDELPPSEYQYQAWWGYEKKPRQPEKQVIANAGWKAEQVRVFYSGFGMWQHNVNPIPVFQPAPLQHNIRQERMKSK